MIELENLLKHYPELECCRQSLINAVDMLCKAFGEGHKLLLIGNGGSAADCEHIVGELQKNFKIVHKRNENFDKLFLQYYPHDEELLSKLTPAIPVISLVSGVSINTALINDTGADVLYAQRAYALCQKGDVLLGISTSGNSELVISAMKVAKTLGCNNIALTGSGGGKMGAYADILIDVPEKQTYRVQELHLPVYHFLCAQIEHELFGN